MEMSFDESLATFVEIDDELKQLSEKAKELRRNKAALEAAISSHMVKNEIPEQTCTDTSRIKVYTKKSTKTAYNKAGVYECAQLMLGTDKAVALVKLIEARKNVKESTGLKRLGGSSSSKTK